MEYRRTVIAVLVVTMAAALTPAFADLKVVNRSTVVHVDEADPATIYSFLAAVPTAIYRKGNDLYQGLLTTDTQSVKANVYLLQDWASYVQAKADPTLLVLVGAVPAEVEQILAQGLGNPTVARIQGEGPIALSAGLARSTWKSSETAVLAPYVAQPTDEDVEGLANAAVYASGRNVPLLFVKTDCVCGTSLGALSDLGVKNVVVFDPTKKLAAEALAPLGEAGITVSGSMQDLKSVVGAVLSGAESSTLCLIQSSFKGLPAAIAGARYQGAVLKIPASIREQSVRAYRTIPRILLSLTEKLPRPVKADEDLPSGSSLAQTAKKFYEWLEGLGADNPGRLETVITFAQGSELGGVPLTLERALTGDPSKPEAKGALTSRMPGTTEEDVAYINRTTLYRALIFANPRPKRVTMTMVAYEAQNNGATSTGPFTDTSGKKHRVNEFFGCREGGYDDPGVYETLKNRGYDVGFHDGRAQGTGEDPINHEANWGFWKDLKDGTTYYYDSSHGGSNAWYPLGVDDGIVQDVAWGQPMWPSPDGRVNAFGDDYSAADVDRDYENLHSPVAIYNACLIGGGSVMNTMLQHGSAASIGSYTSVSFDGSGWFCCVFNDQMTRAGTSLGQAVAEATARSSQVFANGQTNGDSSLRYVLFGDARMEYVKTDWARPSPLAAEGQRVGGNQEPQPAPPAQPEPPAEPPAQPPPPAEPPVQPQPPAP